MITFDPRFTKDVQSCLLHWFDHLKNQTPLTLNSFKISSCLYPYGLGLDETLWFIFQEAHNQFDFIQYLNSHANFDIAVNTQLEPTPFTQYELEQFNQQGYIVLKNAISPELAAETKQAIYTFIGATETDRESWYNTHPNKRGMMVVYTQHPSMLKIRKSTKVKKAFEQLYGHSDIYPSIDKVSFNPPATPTKPFMGSDIHWDVSLAQPIPFSLQGLIYLNDVNIDDGAFHCVPNFQHKVSDWIKTVPKSEDLRSVAASSLKHDLVGISGNAGDMIIWQQALPHCATPNKGHKPRLVQYLTYLPFELEVREEWI